MERAFAFMFWIMTSGTLLMFSLYLLYRFGVYEGKRQTKKLYM